MKKFNFFLFAALATAISMILPACSDSDDGPGGDKLVGTWQSCKATGYESHEGRVSKELDGEYYGDAIVLYSNGVYDVVNSRLLFDDQISAGYPTGKWSYKGNTLTIGWGEEYDEVSKFTVESLSSTEMQLHYKYSEDEYVYDWVVTFVRVDSDNDDHE